MKTACIYHSIDLDGWMSAAIVKHWFATEHTGQEINIVNYNNFTDLDISTINPSNLIVFIGYNHGQPIPNLSVYDKVIMCDISFPAFEMFELDAKTKRNLIWIDHHISAIKDIEPNGSNIDGSRNINFAACELTWKYFFPNEQMPEIVRLLGRYDCFGHKPQWKSIEGYEGIYEVSSHGKVRSVDRVVIENNTNKSKQLRGKELSAAISKRGYLVVNLFKDNIGTLRNIHDLVAKAFIPNSENKPTVNHKDSNRLNCYATNLEWNTYEENNHHSITNGDRGFPVSQYDKNNNYITTFDSIIIAEKETGITSQNIGKVCKGERNSAGGYIWKYDAKKSTPQFILPDEETKVLEFQYGARSCISNYEEAYKELRECQTYFPESGYPTREGEILTVGKGIYTYLCTEAKQSYKNGFEINFNQTNYHPHDGVKKFICINKERFNPINFDIDYHKDGYDGAACFHFDGTHWCFSLYNDNGEVDCSQIAKQFGGGGHKGAAGFRISFKDNNIDSFIRARI